MDVCCVSSSFGARGIVTSILCICRRVQTGRADDTHHPSSSSAGTPLEENTRLRACQNPRKTRACAALLVLVSAPFPRSTHRMTSHLWAPNGWSPPFLHVLRRAAACWCWCCREAPDGDGSACPAKIPALGAQRSVLWAPPGRARAPGMAENRAAGACEVRRKYPRRTKGARCSCEVV